MSTNRLPFQNEYVKVKNADYHLALDEALAAISKERLGRVIMSLSESDMDMQFVLAARIVPLSMDDTITFIHHACRYFREGREFMDSRAQSRLALVTGALLAKANDNVHAGVLLGGACICFAVVRALEPMVVAEAAAGGDGVGLRRLVGDAFDVLREIIMEVGDKLEFSLIGLMAEAQMNERVLAAGLGWDSVSVSDSDSDLDLVSRSVSGGRCFDEQWMDLVKGFKVSAQGAGFAVVE